MSFGSLLLLAGLGGSIGASEITGSLTVNNVLGDRYEVGQSWTLRLEGAPPDSPFALCLAREKSGAVCKDNAGRTDASGAWSHSGNFDGTSTGGWTEWIQFPSGARSNRISFTVGNPTLGELRINGALGGNFAVGEAWTVTLRGAPAKTAFGRCRAQEEGPASCVANFGVTDSAGSWTLSGTFPEPARGGWTEWLQFPTGYDSNRVTFTVGTTIAYQLHGLNLGPYTGTQDPNSGLTISAEQIRERIARVAPYTRWIRSFSSTHGLEQIGRIARSFGLKTAVGAWLGRNSAANELEIEGALATQASGDADILIVGSETLYRRDLTEAQLASYIRRVKQAAPRAVVTTADTAQSLLDSPSVVAECDALLVNIYPYWEGSEIGHAVSALHTHYKALRSRYPNKEIMISETGWPSAGNTVAQAAPTAENAAFYLLNVVSWARALDIKYFHFEAYDEAWKARYEGPQGAHWGIWTASGGLKPGMAQVFQGKTMPNNWENTLPPCAPGPPLLEFTDVPQYGSTDNLRGRACNVAPAGFRVVIYIKVGVKWWIKPYANRPLTVIQSDGTWSVDITTGGIDPKATEIAAYLVRTGFNPPVLLGSPTLPATLDAAAVAQARTTRTVCEFSVTLGNRSVAADRQQGSAAVTVNAGCEWKAVSNAEWITITSGAGGSGNGTVSYIIAANSSGTSRSGSLMIADRTITIRQAGEGVTCGRSPVLTYGMTVVCTKTEKADEYRFSGAVGDRIIIEGSALDASQFLPCVTLTRPDGRRVRACGLSLVSRLILALDQTGIHRIEMDGGPSGVYSLSLERLLPPSRAAREIRYDAPVADEIAPPGDLDLYHFQGKAGDTIRVSTTSLGGANFLPCIVLTAPDATRKSACGIWSTTNTINMRLTQQGVHTVLVHNNAGAHGPIAAGKYSLSLRCVEGACSVAK